MARRRRHRRRGQVGRQSAAVERRALPRARRTTADTATTTSPKKTGEGAGRHVGRCGDRQEARNAETESEPEGRQEAPPRVRGHLQGPVGPGRHRQGQRDTERTPIPARNGTADHPGVAGRNAREPPDTPQGGEAHVEARCGPVPGTEEGRAGQHQGPGPKPRNVARTVRPHAHAGARAARTRTQRAASRMAERAVRSHVQPPAGTP